ncbi:MAG: hypothetical protein ACI8PB_002230 [Desulforhopalus sp.]|jgi:hypothetical protein
MDQKNEVFNKTYNEYLDKLKILNLPEIARNLNLKVAGHDVLVSLLGTDYRVSESGVFGLDGRKVDFEKCIVIFKYLLMCPKDVPTEINWVAYHSFKNAQPLLHYFARETTKPMEDFFSGKLTMLEQFSKNIGGVVVTDNASYDLSIQFNVMPHVPLFLRFNDADEDFPAQCTILFLETIEKFLDMESVSILGALFAKKLIASS